MLQYKRGDNMIKKSEIINEAVINIFGKEVASDEVVKSIVDDYSDQVVSFEDRSNEGWETLQHNDKRLPHGFIYYSCNKANLFDLLNTIEVYAILFK